MSDLTCAGCGGPVDVQHKAGLPPCDLHPPVLAELRMHLSVEITGPIDWPDRFLAAALVARDFGRGDLPRALERMAHFGSPAEVEAIGRALLGEGES